MPKEHLLKGLEPDNLLAFLALLGFHRCVSHARADWNPRVFWDGVPSRPWMVLAQPVGRAELLDAAVRAANELAEVHSFEERANLDYKIDEARREFENAFSSKNHERIDLLSALMSDAAARDDRIRATPFCAMFGQGHQNFLERLAKVPKGLVPKELQGKITQEELNSASKLEEALFQPWERRDSTQSFRWDPLEDRRYALRFEDPSSDKGLTVHGANRLAALALPLLTAIPKRERGEVRIYALGTKWDSGSLVVRWPVWSRPATLIAVRMMLAGCGVGIGVNSCFAGLGIRQVYRAERISVGKFFNYTRAIPE
jgi:hypothetical protein